MMLTVASCLLPPAVFRQRYCCGMWHGVMVRFLVPGFSSFIATFQTMDTFKAASVSVGGLYASTLEQDDIMSQLLLTKASIACGAPLHAIDSAAWKTFFNHNKMAIPHSTVSCIMSIVAFVVSVGGLGCRCAGCALQTQ